MVFFAPDPPDIELDTMDRPNDALYELLVVNEVIWLLKMPCPFRGILAAQGIQPVSRRQARPA